eukprot:tig00021352_g20697.t1
MRELDLSAAERLQPARLAQILADSPRLRFVAASLAPADRDSSVSALENAVRRLDDLRSLVLKGPFVADLAIVARLVERASERGALELLAVEAREWRRGDAAGFAALLRAARRVGTLRLGSPLGAEQACALFAGLPDMRGLRTLAAAVEAESASMSGLAAAVQAGLRGSQLETLHLTLDGSFASSLPAGAALAAAAASGRSLRELVLRGFQLLDTGVPALAKGPRLRLAILDYDPATLLDARGPSSCPAPRRLLSAPSLSAFAISCWRPGQYPARDAWGEALRELAVDSPEDWQVARLALRSCPALVRLRFCIAEEGPAPAPPGEEERAALARLASLRLRCEARGCALAVWLAAAVRAAPCRALEDVALACPPPPRDFAAAYWEALADCCPALEAAEGPWEPAAGLPRDLLARVRALRLCGPAAEAAAGDREAVEALLRGGPRLEDLRLDALRADPREDVGPLRDAVRAHGRLRRLVVDDAGPPAARFSLSNAIDLLSDLADPPCPLVDPCISCFASP